MSDAGAGLRHGDMSSKAAKRRNYDAPQAKKRSSDPDDIEFKRQVSRIEASDSTFDDIAHAETWQSQLRGKTAPVRPNIRKHTLKIYIENKVVLQVDCDKLDEALAFQIWTGLSKPEQGRLIKALKEAGGDWLRARELFERIMIELARQEGAANARLENLQKRLTEAHEAFAEAAPMKRVKRNPDAQKDTRKNRVRTSKNSGKLLGAWVHETMFEAVSQAAKNEGLSRSAFLERAIAESMAIHAANLIPKVK